MLDAYEKIGASLPLVSAVDTLFCKHPHVQHILADVFEDILDFHKRAVAFFKTPSMNPPSCPTFQFEITNFAWLSLETLFENDLSAVHPRV